jgi:ABC-type branched-subunit amino acid transport system substrate-binding protein
MTLVACGHSDESKAGDPGQTSTTSKTAPTATGDFGPIKELCGPGNAKGATARGVTDSTIQIGVLNDATNSIVPGIGKAFPIVAEAFTDWCNAAGGILGRKIEFVNRDAKLTQGAARITEACLSDFMLVGGNTPLDASTVAPREACKLGAIPAYAASDDATYGRLQALPSRGPIKEANVALVRLLPKKYDEAMQHIGVLSPDNPSLLEPAQHVFDGVEIAGGKVVSFQKIPITGVDNWRTYVQPLVDNVQAVAPPVGDLLGFFRGMNDVGYAPKLFIDPLGVLYNAATRNALKSAPVDAPFYSALAVSPLELADQNPATRQAIDLTVDAGGANPDDVDLGAWSDWILFAEAAKACGSDLTVDCVISNATSRKSFDAAGLIAPVDLSNIDSIGACRAIMSASSKGFVYDRELTRPTDGIYNCDKRNVVSLVG